MVRRAGRNDLKVQIHLVPPSLSPHSTSPSLSPCRMQLLSWLMLSAAGLVIVTMVTLTSLIPAVAALLGGTLGAMATVLVSPALYSACEEMVVFPSLQLVLSVPPSLSGLMYIVIGGFTGYLLGRSYATPTKGERRSFIDNSMYV